ncbi:uncharacterized protein PpBr36_09926 [Pyricularia pennisetigena]|uniref:uncharacterized protein n=1 Tax=Pyricularia pennisetigena TaxID=1578925 RepID=UPI00114ED080|nr:uncharacterized protein PpBr36_09926 [Pyricularia pennisetigena]TLS22438.1 hypothetical protein PpBr36_09926 [Pyricularia pennisetigena]
MHLVSTLIPVALLLATAQARCYEVKTTWQNEKFPMSEVLGYVAKPDSLAGFFNNGQEKTECKKLAEKKFVRLKVKWLGKNGLTLRDGDCYSELRRLALDCDSGGENTNADWYFRKEWGVDRKLPDIDPATWGLIGFQVPGTEARTEQQISDQGPVMVYMQNAAMKSSIFYVLYEIELYKPFR